MRHETSPTPSVSALWREIAASGPARDADGGFPREAFALLEDRGLVGWPPLGGAEIATLLKVLADVGRGDLSTGRIFEGHVNACLLIRSFGNAAQRERLGAIAAEGGVFGVWNTDQPGEPLTLDGRTLKGRKSFASGVDGLARAIVTVDEPAGRRMVVVPLKGLPVDRAVWRPLGMRASGSHTVDFTGLAIEADWLLGAPGDYVRQPWFSAGAIRFAAVHVGGMHAVFDVAVEHLRRTQRIGDPYQAQRVGRMGIAVETGYAWLDRAAAAWAEAARADGAGAAGLRAVAQANATRIAVEALALTVLEEAERGVGAAGLIAPHPLERLVRDLRTYLRQPNPDGALAALGAAVGDGAWSPDAGLPGSPT